MTDQPTNDSRPIDQAAGKQFVRKVNQDLQASLTNSAMVSIARYLTAHDPNFGPQFEALVGLWKAKTLSDVDQQTAQIAAIQGVDAKVLAQMGEQHLSIHRQSIEHLADKTIELTRLK